MHLDTKGRKKIKILLSGIISLLILILILILPRVEINIKLQNSLFAHTYEFKLSPFINQPLPALNLLPAEDISKIQLTELNNYILVPNSSLVFQKKYLISFLTNKIANEIPASEKLSLSKLKYRLHLKNPGPEPELKVYVETLIFPKINIEEIKNKLRGMSRKKAIDYLSSLPGIREFTLEITPANLFFLPVLKTRIKINEVDN